MFHFYICDGTVRQLELFLTYLHSILTKTQLAHKNKNNNTLNVLNVREDDYYHFNFKFCKNLFARTQLFQLISNKLPMPIKLTAFHSLSTYQFTIPRF